MNRLPVWPDQDSTGVLLSNTDQLSLYNHNVVREAKAMVQTCFWMFTAHLEISSHLALGDLWLTRWGTIQTSNFWEWRGVPSEMVLVNFLFCVQGIKPTFTLIITKVFFFNYYFLLIILIIYCIIIIGSARNLSPKPRICWASAPPLNYTCSPLFLGLYILGTLYWLPTAREGDLGQSLSSLNRVMLLLSAAVSFCTVVLRVALTERCQQIGNGHDTLGHRERICLVHKQLQGQKTMQRWPSLGQHPEPCGHQGEALGF